ncbi:putative hyaluronan and proteoglycan link protein 3-like [Scophthalmus maximus]|uniref:Putative hyaluronan and proteoglycan link protein 3-like n=1 Tax=Scophthalmus maximus TaxID=52904 RepID=A0A2U9BBR3_SCOMX|nr:putative hyaluronan and proteoglycan link protein 3-like [Scophthalmus maximus]
MIRCLQTLLLLLLGTRLTQSAPTIQNNFFYHDLFDGNGNREIPFSGVRIHVDPTQASVFAVRGSNVTLPCRFWYEPELSSPTREVRVKWSWLPASGGQEVDVMVAIGSRCRSFGNFRGRVQLRRDVPGDAALFMTELQLNDTGRYRCEVVDGLEDKSTFIDLELRGVVFPYQHPRGRYLLSFLGAQQVCEEQDSSLATFTQLLQSWKEGLNWCNAGWLADGTVQYPITRPRVPCGGHGLAAGVRNYGRRRLHLHHYDVFCFTSSLRGRVYYLQPYRKMNLTEAQQVCHEDGAEVAKVGQLYAAWQFRGLDHCDAGWLADGSVRYPITRPRKNCGPSEPGVRSFGFPPPQHKHGVYCYKSVDE